MSHPQGPNQSNERIKPWMVFSGFALVALVGIGFLLFSLVPESENTTSSASSAQATPAGPQNVGGTEEQWLAEVCNYPGPRKDFGSNPTTGNLGTIVCNSNAVSGNIFVEIYATYFEAENAPAISGNPNGCRALGYDGIYAYFFRTGVASNCQSQLGGLAQYGFLVTGS